MKITRLFIEPHDPNWQSRAETAQGEDDQAHDKQSKARGYWPFSAEHYTAVRGWSSWAMGLAMRGGK